MQIFKVSAIDVAYVLGLFGPHNLINGAGMGDKEDWEDRFAGQRGDSFPPNGSWLWFNIGKEEGESWERISKSRIEISQNTAFNVIFIVFFMSFGCVALLFALPFLFGAILAIPISKYVCERFGQPKTARSLFYSYVVSWKFAVVALFLIGPAAIYLNFLAPDATPFLKDYVQSLVEPIDNRLFPPPEVDSNDFASIYPDPIASDQPNNNADVEEVDDKKIPFAFILCSVIPSLVFLLAFWFRRPVRPPAPKFSQALVVLFCFAAMCLSTLLIILSGWWLLLHLPSQNY